MKKKIGLVFLLLIIALTFIFIKGRKHDYGIGANVSNTKLELKLKGLKGAKDFVKDNLDNYYIAFKKRIIVVEKDGKSYTVIYNKDFDIKSMDYKDNVLYFSSGNKIYSYSLESKNLKECISDIPNLGDYKDVYVKVNDNYLIASVGSITNSGVVGEDNDWTREFPLEKDHSPKELILNGANFGKDNTGAFKEKGKESFEGQVIPEDKIGNSTLIIYNLENEQYETFAWGIKNITGVDFNSKNKIYASVGGMENSYNSMMKYLTKNVGYALPIKSITEIEEITLDELKLKFSNFVAPQSYYNLNNKKDLLDFLKSRKKLNVIKLD